jgi:hypothetical protein
VIITRTLYFILTIIYKYFCTSFASTFQICLYLDDFSSSILASLLSELVARVKGRRYYNFPYLPYLIKKATTTRHLRNANDASPSET